MLKIFHKYVLPVVLIVSLITSSLFVVPKAHAQWIVNDPVTGTIDWVNTITNIGSKLYTMVIKPIADSISANVVVMYKVAALLAVQQLTRAIIGQGGGAIISDYNNYLYISPQQRAMAQMNSFFTTVSRGRASALNYEGIGPNYDAYLIMQARQTIQGQTFVTNLQDQVTDPKQMFAAGNMKGITAYMQCANNVMCYTLTAQAQYNQEFTKAQDIARSKQDRGFLPKEVNGKITQPAALLQNALLQTDQLGTQLIMNAEDPDTEHAPSAIAQILAGSTISVASRALNYYTSSPAGQEALRNKNDQFPFSLSYSSAGGIGLNAGGATINTGVASAVGGVQIGNTCALGSFSINAQGAAVDVHGNKINCIVPASARATGPSASVNAPSATDSSTGQTVGGGSYSY